MYMIIIVLATLSTYFFIYNEMAGVLPQGAWSGTDPNTDHSLNSSPSTPSSGIRLRILLVLSTSFIIICLLSLVWFRAALHRLNRPIHAIRRAVFRLAQGKLNETVMLESNDELGQIGAGINELAANLQELLLHIWKQTGKCLTTLDHIKQKTDPLNGEAADQMLELVSAIENLREMAKAYVFYDVRLEGDQAVAITQPGQKEQPASPPPQRSLSD